MPHTQFSRVCRCPNLKTCSSVFARIKADALGMVFVLSARVKAENIAALGPCQSVEFFLSSCGRSWRSERLPLLVNIKVSARRD